MGVSLHLLAYYCGLVSSFLDPVCLYLPTTFATFVDRPFDPYLPPTSAAAVNRENLKYDTIVSDAQLCS